MFYTIISSLSLSLSLSITQSSLSSLTRLAILFIFGVEEPHGQTPAQELPLNPRKVRSIHSGKGNHRLILVVVRLKELEFSYPH